MARAAKAATVGAKASAVATKKPKPAFIPDAGWTIELHPDGSLNHDDLEHLACLMADALTGPEAWKALGKSNEGSPGKKRRFAEKHPVFMARLATLRNERTTMETGDPIFGEVQWMAKQLWRAARGKNDVKAMGEAAKLAFDIAKQRAGGGVSRPEAADPEEVEEKRGVGRPAKENPQTKRDPATMRALLLERGLNIGNREEKAETEGEIEEEGEV